jgi:hypothetical protein
MKKRLFVLGLLFASLGVVSAEAPTPPDTWADKLFGPSANRTHDFGIVPRDVKSHHRFVLKNIYAVPIEITSVRRSG